MFSQNFGYPTHVSLEGTRSIIESLQRTNLLPSWSQWSRWCQQVIGQNGQGAMYLSMVFFIWYFNPPPQPKENTYPKSTSCWTNFAVASTLPVVSDPFLVWKCEVDTHYPCTEGENGWRLTKWLDDIPWLEPGKTTTINMLSGMLPVSSGAFLETVGTNSPLKLESKLILRSVLFFKR